MFQNLSTAGPFSSVQVLTEEPFFKDAHGPTCRTHFTSKFNHFCYCSNAFQVLLKSLSFIIIILKIKNPTN